MIKTPETKGRFFSVKFGTVICGVRYVPSVCYRLTSGLQQAVEEMAKGDNPLARIYPEEVRFVSGVVCPVKKPETAKAPPQSSSVPADSVERKKPVKSGTKRTGGSGFTRQAGREFD